nr:MAG TPA: hypothetical protein [Bacteriophage sp.]
MELKSMRIHYFYARQDMPNLLRQLAQGLQTLV